jgi:hypothetical protein
MNIPQMTHCSKYLTPRLAAISHQPSTHPFTDWLTAAESESELLYDWWFTANQFVLATSLLRLTTRIFIFQLNTCGYSPYATSSLMKGWVCRLQLLLGLVSAVILRSESRRINDRILLSQIRDSPILEGQVAVFISLRNRVVQLYPRHRVPFKSPPTARRATVDVFDPASTEDTNRSFQLVQLKTCHHGPQRKHRYSFL